MQVPCPMFKKEEKKKKKSQISIKFWLNSTAGGGGVGVGEEEKKRIMLRVFHFLADKLLWAKVYVCINIYLCIRDHREILQKTDGKIIAKGQILLHQKQNISYGSKCLVRLARYAINMSDIYVQYLIHCMSLAVTKLLRTAYMYLRNWGSDSI